ncbi:MAG: division/cell wall cluster transcriptional repressor MraZ [Bacilli bacterium]|nr:division/cell wall cluster transcriptional repressor MraZ [Bacilli bacterium]
MFMGRYYPNMDDSHRLNIPTNFKKYLETDLVISQSIDQDYRCLWLFNRTDWEKTSSKIEELSIMKKSNRYFQREFLGSSYETTLDPKGRLVIAKELLPFANITKECVVIGSGSRIEIWDKATYEKYQAETEGKLEEESEGIEY